VTDPTAAGPLALNLADHFNFRDLGGLEAGDGARVAWRRLYRGASLHRLGSEELESFQGLGMRTVVDLRSPIEQAETAPPPALGARSLPMFDRLPSLPEEPDDVDAMMVDLYLWLLEAGAGAIAAMLALLAEEDAYPFAFYCAAGKDRTGVMTAIVFSLLGVPRELIVRDYALSDAPVEALRRWIEDGDDQQRHGPVPAGVFRAPATTMRSFLDRVDQRYGSMAGYRREIGVAAAVDAAVARNLLIPATP
jgi:protein-tyrosine phosphatase